MVLRRKGSDEKLLRLMMFNVEVVMRIMMDFVVMS